MSLTNTLISDPIRNVKIRNHWRLLAASLSLFLRAIGHGSFSIWTLRTRMTFTETAHFPGSQTNHSSSSQRLHRSWFSKSTTNYSLSERSTCGNLGPNDLIPTQMIPPRRVKVFLRHDLLICNDSYHPNLRRPKVQLGCNFFHHFVTTSVLI